MLPRLNVQISYTHTAPLLEGTEGLDDLIKTDVGVESGLDVVEEDDGAVRASAAELAVGRHRGREADRVVESQAERLVRLLSALAAVEQILLDVVANSEQSAASGVGRGVHTVRASDPTGEGAC